MTPLGEVRLALPVALTLYHLNPLSAYLLSVLGNLVPVIFLLKFLGPFSHWLSQHFRFFQKFFNWLFERTKRKYNLKVQRYGPPILIAFVATPLPVTGAWTGALVAFLFGLSLKKAFFSITLGVLIAGAIVLTATKAGIALGRYFGWQVFLGILLGTCLGWFFYKTIKGGQNKKDQNQ